MGKLNYGQLLLCLVLFVNGLRGETKQGEPRRAAKACQIYETQTVRASFRSRSDGAADFGEFPYMAGLGYRLAEQNIECNVQEIRCGGILIAAKFVLTAAHCTTVQPIAFVRLNIVNFADENQLRNVRDVPVKAIHKHENYTSSAKYNNIAIVELAEDVAFTPNLRPACLYTENDDPPADKDYYVTGWGFPNQEKRRPSTTLKKIPVKIVPISQCNATYAEYGFVGSRNLRSGIVETQLCASSEENAPIVTCNGDSGGPLSMVLDDDSKINRVAGVLGFGMACGSTVPDVYTRISAYLDWIEDIVWPEHGNI